LTYMNKLIKFVHHFLILKNKIDYPNETSDFKK
jgi:hypothetical protein